jgi:hypothetical protein
MIRDVEVKNQSQFLFVNPSKVFTFVVIMTLAPLPSFSYCNIPLGFFFSSNVVFPVRPVCSSLLESIADTLITGNSMFSYVWML